MPDQATTALITEPTALFAFLAAILGLVFYLSTLEPLKKLFEYMPPVIWAYFVPMIATTLGITPSSSEVYSWMSRYLLPFSLFLLMITVDLPAQQRGERMHSENGSHNLLGPLPKIVASPDVDVLVRKRHA